MERVVLSHQPTHTHTHTQTVQVHTKTIMTHTNCAVNFWDVTGWWVFLFPTVSLSIYISLQNQRIHQSLTSLLSVFYSVTFLFQPACNKSSTLVLVKWKGTFAIRFGVRVHMGMVGEKSGRFSQILFHYRPITKCWASLSVRMKCGEDSIWKWN